MEGIEAVRRTQIHGKEKTAGDRVYSCPSRVVRLEVVPPRSLYLDRLLELRPRLSIPGAARSAEYLVLHRANRPRISRPAARLASGLVWRSALRARTPLVSAHLLHHDSRTLLSAPHRSLVRDLGRTSADAKRRGKRESRRNGCVVTAVKVVRRTRLKTGLGTIGSPFPRTATENLTCELVRETEARFGS